MQEGPDVNGGNDVMHGGGGGDSMVDQNGVIAMFGDAGNDTLSSGSAGGGLMDGGADNDRLFASGGGMTLRGGTGDDKLEIQGGGPLANIMTGGTGTDTFVYRVGVADNNRVTVTDFQDGIDKIGYGVHHQLSEFVINNVGADAVITSNLFPGASPMTLTGMAGLITTADFVNLL
jgi:Ca2+-binding RTX toxin-like protein